jgi:hypothetical protein
MARLAPTMPLQCGTQPSPRPQERGGNRSRELGQMPQKRAVYSLFWLDEGSVAVLEEGDPDEPVAVFKAAFWNAKETTN